MNIFNFLNNLEIKGKLLLLVSFPLLALLWFSGQAVYYSYATGNNVQNATTLVIWLLKSQPWYMKHKKKEV